MIFLNLLNISENIILVHLITTGEDPETLLKMTFSTKVLFRINRNTQDRPLTKHRWMVSCDAANVSPSV